MDEPRAYKQCSPNEGESYCAEKDAEIARLTAERDAAIEREAAATDRANVAEAANLWRKVSEEMPEEFRDVLVGWTSNRKVCKAWQFEGMFQEDAYNDGIFKKQPTHWRPLPAPPKED